VARRLLLAAMISLWTKVLTKRLAWVPDLGKDQLWARVLAKDPGRGKLQALGLPARAFVQHQIGIATDGRYTNARIVEVRPGKILEAVRDGYVAVVGGFMGTTPEGELNTLGRGGSDTTAVALAAAAGAHEAEIFTDTDGVFTTDPHRIPEASKIDHIAYDPMIEMAALGAKVLHPRAVWYAKRYGVRLHVRSAFNFSKGTIVSEEAMKLDRPVTGVAIDEGQAQIGLVGIPDRPGIASRVFDKLAERGIAVDMIIQGVPGHDASRTQMAFTVPKDYAEDALEALRYNDDARVLVVTGAGDSFSAGMDLI